MSERSFFEITNSRQKAMQRKIISELKSSAELPYALADAAHSHASKFLEGSADAAETACEAGCSYCCHQPATVFPFEAIRIARVLTTTLSKGELAALKETMKARVGGLKGASVGKNIENRAACPLLSADGRCSIYADRPLTCRLAHSFSVKRCRLSYEKSRAKVEIPISLELLTGISGIIEAAFERFGDLYELCSAVLKALEKPEADLKWARGDSSVFAGCIKDDT